MVAFVENFEFAETALRGRAQRHRSTFRGVRCLNSNRQANLRSATYDGRRRLESCSKDPILVVGKNGEYRYADSKPVTRVDPTGTLDIRPHTDAPEGPFGGRTCSIAVRCFAVAPIGTHCGLIMVLDDEEYSIDGTGGDRNKIDWVNPPHYPVPWYPHIAPIAPGPFRDYPVSVCECLRQRSRQWNTQDVPRNSFTCNSNTTLRCLISKCGINLNWGSGIEGVLNTPFRYNQCKRYRCVKWNQGCRRSCSKFMDFCDYWFGLADGSISATGLEE